MVPAKRRITQTTPYGSRRL